MLRPALSVLVVSVLAAAPVAAQTFLTADGTTDSYTLINDVLGASPETPDCSHASFGHHITQAFDSEFGKSAFVFHIHVTPDNDRCTNFDRQRLEIKTDGGSPAELKGMLNDSVTYRWKFKLADGFQPSPNFTHVHQIKAGDGDTGAPIITLTPRAGSPEILQLIHTDSAGAARTLTSTALAPFVGEWVEAYEKVTYSHTGSYSIVIRRLRDGATLLNYNNGSIDLWRTGTTFCRPKWGIYRSLNSQSVLRDEDVRFDRFCIAKGSRDCPGDQPSPDFSIAAAPAAQTVTAGHSAAYTVSVSGKNGFGSSVSLGVSGLPAGASGTFNPTSIAGSGTSTLTVTTSASTPVATSTLSIRGDGGALSHSTSASLTVAAARVSVEAEAAGTTLSGAAAVAACSACSGGKKVRFIGNGAANFATLNGVSVPTAGSYTLTITYTVSGTRTFFVSVNGAAAVQVSTTGTSFSTPASTSVPVTLRAGSNSIKFFNNSAFAADLDRITVH